MPFSRTLSRCAVTVVEVLRLDFSRVDAASTGSATVTVSFGPGSATSGACAATEKRITPPATTALGNHTTPHFIPRTYVSRTDVTIVAPSWADTNGKWIRATATSDVVSWAARPWAAVPWAV